MIDTLYKFVDELLGRPYKKVWEGCVYCNMSMMNDGHGAVALL